MQAQLSTKIGIARSPFNQARLHEVDLTAIDARSEDRGVFAEHLTPIFFAQLHKLYKVV